MPRYESLEWTEEQVARFWDYESQFPERYFTNRYGDVIIRRLGRFLRQSERILDFGCGMGFLVGHLLRQGFRTAGADFSPRSVQKVRTRFASDQNFLGAFEPRDFAAGQMTFDAVLAVEVVEHLGDAALADTLRMIRGATRRGGVVIFTTPNAERLSESEVFCAGCSRVFHRYQHVRSWDADSLRDRLEAASFSVTDIFTTDFRASFRKHKLLALQLRAMKLARRGLVAPNLVAVCRTGV